MGPHKNSFERRQSVFDTKGNLITSWKPTEGHMETSGKKMMALESGVCGL